MLFIIKRVIMMIKRFQFYNITSFRCSSKKDGISNYRYLKIELSMLVLVLAFIVIAAASVTDQEVIKTAQNDSIQKSTATDQNKDTHYVVRKGDTFWDIALELVGDPFEWPNVWKGNDHIKNPDLIYPGNIVMISAKEPADSALAKTKNFSGNNIQRNLNQTQDTLLLNNKTVFGPNFFLRIPYLWNKKNSSGKIYPGDAVVDKPVDKKIYHLFDIITFSKKNDSDIKIGDTVDIYSSLCFVNFKKTTANLIRVCGRAEVTKLDEEKGHARIFEMFDLIKGKERIAKAGKNEQKELYGFLKPEISVRAEVFKLIEKKGLPYLFEAMIISQGASQGIKTGDMFAIYHKEKHKTERLSMIGYAGKVTSDSATLIIINIIENKVVPGDEAVLIARSGFVED